MLFATAGCGATHPAPKNASNLEESGPAEINPGSTPVTLTAAWANDGGDKVTQDELRGSSGGSPGVINHTWDGQAIHLFGAMNEVVSFNLVLEAARGRAEQVSVVFDHLAGPHGGEIRSQPVFDTDALYDWTGRSIENFFVRYLPIRGLSLLSYENYDERHIPRRLRRPWTGEGTASGTWNDRPDHDKNYPDVAVPLELNPTFAVDAGQNQSIWTDIYIPKDIPRGIYQGAVKVYERGQLSYFVPVQLSVKNFTLPDSPSSKTMIYLGSDMNTRYTGVQWPDPGTPEAALARKIRDRHFMLAHRHKLSLFDADSGVTAWKKDEPSPEWIPRLDGTLFTESQGYAGPGVGVGNGVYSVGTYGSWSWKKQNEAAMWQHTDAWGSWFEQNSPDTERFLYLIDESANLKQIETWSRWMRENPGVGSGLASMTTIDLPSARRSTPDLSIATSFFNVGDTDTWASNLSEHLAEPAKRYFQYNGKRPSQGSFAIEDDGVALRELPWAQYKMGVQRWMFWESTYLQRLPGRPGPDRRLQDGSNVQRLARPGRRPG